MRVRAQQGDTLDALCWRHYGTTTVLEQVLEANPGLADLGAVLPHGTEVELPDLTATAQARTAPTVQLWD
jgi:phage tail protein X